VFAGHVIALDSPGELLEGSLGLFGVITEVTLQVTGARKVSVLQVQQEDVYMLEEIRDVIDSSKVIRNLIGRSGMCVKCPIMCEIPHYVELMYLASHGLSCPH
jgi:hypothetical protein